ncbi:ATP-binding cassette domain-containing protein [Stakelama tenebrarum]|uniref:ATP-binding cassette domain-containing protein n=1 Tax=Stakelama tenebrarum TaxID=2711215 RepID=A0A6G6Y4A6_9SPHN|nr:ATP-binding cassette domain-containing protein [Sphingosinithalassobacter tenebrarum]QIG79762.1 ATP-binding cassette domain-containing protein [Sphingosinithalassobacter tenebrarum]
MSFDLDVTLRRGERDIACRIEVGEGLTVLFGPSGAGKTSVLHMVAGLLRPDTGHIRVGGRTLFDHAAGVNLPPEARRGGVVFQEARLFPHMRVRDNLLYGQALPKPPFALSSSKRGPSCVRNEDERTGLRQAQPERGEGSGLSLDRIDFLGIGHLLDRWPRTLSGGEARRVAIGRALLSDPRFLLLDEPLSSLDPARREEVMRVIERLRDAMRLPILMVTHDREEAARLGTRTVHF